TRMSTGMVARSWVMMDLRMASSPRLSPPYEPVMPMRGRIGVRRVTRPSSLPDRQEMPAQGAKATGEFPRPPALARRAAPGSGGRQRAVAVGRRHGLAFSLLLMLPEASIDATGGDQLAVSALLDDATVLQHDDVVGVHDGGQPVGDHQCGAPGGH